MRIGGDYIQYDPLSTSASFYVCIILRGIEFQLPAVLALAVGVFLRIRRTSKEK